MRDYNSAMTANTDIAPWMPVWRPGGAAGRVVSGGRGLGMIVQMTGWYKVDVTKEMFSLFPDFSHGLSIAKPHMFAFNFNFVTEHFLYFLTIVFAFLFVDLFDTAGTLIGIANKGNLTDENGNLPRAGRALLSDALGTVFGACVGTSTVTSYSLDRKSVV